MYEQREIIWTTFFISHFLVCFLVFFCPQLLPVVEASLFDPKPTLSRSPLYSSVSAFLRSLESKAETSNLAAVFWSQLSDDLVGMFATVGSGGEQSLRPDRLVSFVKALLIPRDASSPVSMKNERVRFAADVSKPQARVPASTEVEISDAMKSFVKKVVVHSHKLYQQDRLCVHLKLFVDLANLYFPADIATFVSQSLDSNTENGSGEGTAGSGEGTADSGEGTTGSGESSADAHSRVIDKVVLPVLAGMEGNESREEVVDHTITLLFACLPYLSQKSSTDVWDNVLRVSILSCWWIWMNVSTMNVSQQEPLLKQLYLQLISEYPLSEIFFTNSSKTEEGVAVAAVSIKRIKKPFTCQLPDNSFQIYSRVEGYSFSSQTCLLFQRKIIFDIIWFPFIVTVYIKPKIWSSSLSSDFRIIYRNDKRGERDCFHLGSRPCWH